MRKHLFLLLAVTVLVMALCAAGFADGIPDADEVLNRILNTTYYSLDTLQEINEDQYSIIPNESDPTERIYLSGERATSGSVEFESGDEWMKDLVMWIKNISPGENAIGVGAHDFSQPGEATFHITAASKNNSFDQAYTVKVVPFPENAFEPKENAEIRIVPGASYTEQELIAMTGTLAPELAESSVDSFMFHGSGNGQEYWLDAGNLGVFYQYEKTEMTGIISFSIANAQFAIYDVKIGPVPFSLKGPKNIYPGAENRYTIMPAQEGTPVPGDFVLTAEGAEIDADGKLILKENAKSGDEITVTASSAEAELTCTLTATVADNPLKSLVWTETEVSGIVIPMANTESGTFEEPRYESLWEGLENNFNISGSGQLTQDFWFNTSTNVLTYTQPNAMDQLMRNAAEREEDWKQREYEETGRVYINGYPVVYGQYTESHPNDNWANRFVECSGMIGRYEIYLFYSVNGNTQAGMPPLGTDILLETLSRITIDGQPVEMRNEPPAFSVSGPQKIYPGMDIIYKIIPVLEEIPVPGDTVLTAEGAEIDAEGKLTLKEDVKAGDTIVVTATSAESDYTAVLKAEVIENPLNNITWTEAEEAGLTIPIASVENGTVNGPNQQDLWDGVEANVSFDSNGPVPVSNGWFNMSISYQLYTRSNLTILEMYRNSAQSEEDWKKQDYDDVGRVYLNGYPILYRIRKEINSNDDWQNNTIECNGQLGNYQFYLFFNVSGSIRDGVPPVDKEFMEGILGRIKVDGEPVQVKDQAPAFIVSGPQNVYPGNEIRYAVVPVTEDTAIPGDTVLTAEGAEIDAEGKLTLKEDAKAGDIFTVIASSAEADYSFTITGTVSENPLNLLTWSETEDMAGIVLPVYEGENKEGPIFQDVWNGVEVNAYGNSYGNLPQTNLWYNYNYNITKYTRSNRTFKQMMQDLKWSYNDWTQRSDYVKVGYVYVNGCPLIYGIRLDTQEDGNWQNQSVDCYGQVGPYSLSIYNNISGNPNNGVPSMDVDFLGDVLSRIRIDGEPVEVIAHEPVPELIQADGITETSAGVNVAYTAGDAQPIFGALTWQVTNENGEATKAATVDKKGTVRTGRVTETEKVIIRVKYENCSDSASASTELTIWPAVKKINILTTGTYLYLDSNHSLTLTPAADPENAKLMGLTWTMSKEGFAELTENEDGSVTLTPVSAGVVTVTVTDAAGKKGTVKITVTDQPVTAVEIVTKGAAAPGKTVTLTAKTIPDKPACKDVTWSINVDESIATVDAKGILKIAKETEPGTVITVTCTALGAPEPVTTTLDVTVE